MSTPNIAEQVRWQDLRVRSVLDLVFEIAKKENWEDCEVFGSGDMITQPQESMGWKLIPANLYEDSIPLEAVGRLHQIINAGVRVRGVIIADDERRQEPAPEATRLDKPKIEPPPAPVIPDEHRADLPPAPDRDEASLSEVVSGIVSMIGKALFGLICIAGGLALAWGAISLIGVIGRTLTHFWPVVLVGLFILTVTGVGSSSGVDYDPKLVILVDDGKGGTAWISLFTWYD